MTRLTTGEFAMGASSVPVSAVMPRGEQPAKSQFALARLPNSRQKASADWGRSLIAVAAQTTATRHLVVILASPDRGGRLNWEVDRSEGPFRSCGPAGCGWRSHLAGR